MQNIFGITPGTVQASQPDAPLTTPQLMGQPPSNPWQNISLTPAASNSVPNTPPEIPAGESVAATGGGRRMADMMASMYHPETAASDRLNTMISSYPSREANQPSMLRRIGGALMAFGGSLPQGRGMDFYHANPEAIQSGLNFMDKPFTDKLEDWKNQLQPVESAATLERYHNVNERTMAYQAVSAQLRDEAEQHKIANDAVNAEIKQHRADIYEFKARHPGAKFDFRGPTVMVGDPITGKAQDTGVPTGHLSDLDKINLNQENALERIGATGNENRKTEVVRQTGRESLEDKRQEGRRDLLTWKQRFATGAGGKPETPQQTRIRQFNNAREVYNTRPDLRPFIKLGTPGTNDFTVTPPSDSNFFGWQTHSGPSQKLYEEARDLIYGQTAPAPAPSHGSPNSTTPQNGPNLGTQPPQRGNIGGNTGPESKIYDRQTGQLIGTILTKDVGEVDKSRYRVE